MTEKITDRRREYLDDAVKELALREQLHELQGKRWLPSGSHYFFDKEPPIDEQEFQAQAARFAVYRKKLDIENSNLLNMELLHTLLETLDAEQRELLFRLATEKQDESLLQDIGISSSVFFELLHDTPHHTYIAKSKVR